MANDLMVRLLGDGSQLMSELGKSAAAVDSATLKMADAASYAKGALIGLAGAVSVGAFASLVKGTIDANAGLHDLAQKTGASVEALSAMRGIAKLSGADLESVGASMTKLAKNMTGMGDDSKEASRALAALGLSGKEIGKMGTDQAMQAIAVAMSGFKDSADKSAIAMALFGKNGAQLIPFFNDLGKAGDLQAKVTSEQAAQADNLQDNMIKLAASSDAWKKELANGMIPTLNQASEAFLGVMNETGGLRDEVRKLVDDGSIEKWTKAAVDGLTYVMDAAHGVVVVVGAVAKTISAAVAQATALATGNLSLAQGIGQAWLDDMDKLFSTDLIGDRLRKSFAQVGQAKAQATSDYVTTLETFLKDFEGADAAFIAKTVKGIQIAYGRAEKDVSDFKSKVKATADATDAFASSWSARIAALQAEANGTDKLTATEKAYAEALANVTSGKTKLTAVQLKQLALNVEEALSLEKKIAAQKKETEEAKKWSSEADKALEAQQKDLEALDKKAVALEDQAKHYGWSEQAIYLATVAQLENRRAIAGSIDDNEAEVDALNVKIAAYRRMADAAGSIEYQKGQAEAAKKAASEWDKAADQVGQSLADAIMSGGQSAGQLLKNYFKTLVLRPIIQGVVNGALGMVGVGGSGSAVAGAAGSAGSLYQAGSNLYSAYNTGSTLVSVGGQYLSGTMSAANAAGTIYANATTSGAYTALDGLLATNSAYGTAGTAVAAGEAGAAAEGALAGISATGWGAIAAVVILAVMALLPKGGGPKTEGDAFGTLTDSSGGLKFGTTATTGDGAWYTGSSADAAVQGMLKPVGVSIANYITSLGGDVTGLGINLGMNSDPHGSAPPNVSAGVTDASGRVIYRQTWDGSRDNEQEMLALAVKRITVASIAAANGIEPIYRAIVSAADIANSSSADLDAIFAHIASVQSILGYASADPFAQAATEQANASKTILNTWNDQASGIRSLAVAYDGSVASTNALAAATSTFYATEMALVRQINSGLASAKTDTADAIKTIHMSVLDNAGKYSYLDAEAEKERQKLIMSSDPAQINQYAANARADIMAAWNLLSDTQKVAQEAEFTTRLSSIETLQTQRLNAVADGIKDDREALGQVIKDAMDAAAAKMQAAADAQAAAAAIQLAAANTPTRVQVSIDNTAAANQVGGWGGN